MYIFVYVPAAGRIASATARNRAGPLPMQSPSGRGRARACGGRLQRSGASLPCDISAIKAGAQGKDRALHEIAGWAARISENGSLGPCTVSSLSMSWQ